MIEINFLTSPDSEVLGPYKFFYNSILIGTSKKNDLIIEDPEMEDFHMRLTATKDGLICESTKETTLFLVNDKFLKGKKAFGKKEKIKIGGTIFEIIDFSLEPQSSKEPSLKEAYEKTLKDFPEQEKLIDEIENEMSHLAELSNNPPSNS